MVRKTYNVVLQSAIGDGATTSGETFFYDWTQLPDVPYNVSFSFMSATIAMTSIAQIASLYVDLTVTIGSSSLSASSIQSLLSSSIHRLTLYFLNLFGHHYY